MDIEDQFVEINYHELSGILAPKTLRFEGTINGKTVSMLVDTWSTHNSVQAGAAKRLD